MQNPKPTALKFVTVIGPIAQMQIHRIAANKSQKIHNQQI